MASEESAIGGWRRRNPVGAANIMNIRAIGFDYGGVIEGSPGSIFEKGAGDILGVSRELFKKVYFENNFLVNTGKLTWDEFWKKVLIELGKTEKTSEFFEFLKNQPKLKINNDVVQLISKLKSRGYKVGILSNNSIEKAQKIRSSEIAKYFDTMVFSEEVGYMKPQLEIFEIFIKNLDIKIEELAFVDDTEQSLKTAKEIGFSPILFTGYESLVKDLQFLGIEL